MPTLLDGNGIHLMVPLLAALILTSTASDVSTGGNTVSAGGHVQNGSAYSSVSQLSVVNQNENDYGASTTSVTITNTTGGGTAIMHIKTDTNGEVHEETVTKQIPVNGSLDIEVATSSGNSNVRSALQVSNGATPLQSSSTPQYSKLVFHTFGSQLQALFRQLLSFFSFRW